MEKRKNFKGDMPIEKKSLEKTLLREKTTAERNERNKTKRIKI